MGFNSAFKGLKLLKPPGNGRLNNLNDPNRPQCVKTLGKDVINASEFLKILKSQTFDCKGKCMCHILAHCISENEDPGRCLRVERRYFALILIRT